MEEGKSINSFLLTLIFHAVILFGVRNQVDLEKTFLPEQLKTPAINAALAKELPKPMLKKERIKVRRIKPRISKTKYVKKVKNIEVRKDFVQSKLQASQANQANHAKSVLTPAKLKDIEQYALELRAYEISLAERYKMRDESKLHTYCTSTR